MIRRIAALGVSVLLIEHHVELIMAVADTVTVLDYGQVIASDRPRGGAGRSARDRGLFRRHARQILDEEAA